MMQIALGLLGWFAAAAVGAIALGRVVRNADRQDRRANAEAKTLENERMEIAPTPRPTAASCPA